MVLDQEAIDKFGIIGEVTIEQGFGSHPAHVYRLHRDSIVEHGYRTTEDDGLDEEGYEINTRYNSQYLGFLSVRQLQGLLNTLRNVDGFIDPDIALSDASRASLNARSDEVRRILDHAGDEQRDDRTYYQRYMEDLEEQNGYREDADQSGVDEWDDVEHMDLLAMERNEGPDGEAVDGYGNRIDADY